MARFLISAVSFATACLVWLIGVSRWGERTGAESRLADIVVPWLGLLAFMLPALAAFVGSEYDSLAADSVLIFGLLASPALLSIWMAVMRPSYENGIKLFVAWAVWSVAVLIVGLFSGLEQYPGPPL